MMIFPIFFKIACSQDDRCDFYDGEEGGGYYLERSRVKEMKSFEYSWTSSYDPPWDWEAAADEAGGDDPAGEEAGGL